MTELIKIIVEIGLIFICFYFLMVSLRGSIFRGVIFGFVVLFTSIKIAAKKFEMTNIDNILGEWFLLIVVIALVIVFQPELRKILLRLGQNRIFHPFISAKSSMIDETVEAVFGLAEKRYGALIAIEREIALKPYIEGGTYVDADVSSELLQSIFFPGSALHDGGVVIKDGRIISAGCVFPLTENQNIDKKFGTRHRAGIGLTEESDAIVLVASEETGNVSLCLNGQLKTGFDKETMKKTLHDIYHK